MSRLFIGMPVYNGECFITRALESLIAQSFTDWVLMISDNCSIDSTEVICKKFASRDSRISYIKQSTNLGAINNFRFVLSQARSEYFMWAAADDEWLPDFIKVCIELLDNHRDIGMAFTGINNIDSFDRVIRQYPNFHLFASRSHYRTIFNYLISPEIMGKANLIYSIYRLPLCREAMRTDTDLMNGCGYDMSFVLAALARGGILIDDRLLFQKRLVREDDNIECCHQLCIEDIEKCVFPPEEFPVYFKACLKAVRGTSYLPLTFVIMLFRRIRIVDVGRKRIHRLVAIIRETIGACRTC